MHIPSSAQCGQSTYEAAKVSEGWVSVSNSTVEDMVCYTVSDSRGAEIELEWSRSFPGCGLSQPLDIPRLVKAVSPPWQSCRCVLPPSMRSRSSRMYILSIMNIMPIENQNPET